MRPAFIFRISSFFLLFFNSLLFCSLISQRLLSKTSDKSYYWQGVVGKKQPLWTLARIQKQSKKTKKRALILIPGLNSQDLSGQLYEFGQFWQSWKKSSYINSQQKESFELLVFHYDGWESLNYSAKVLEKSLKEYLQQNQEIKELYFIGYSQGGIIPRILFANNQTLEKQSKKIITWATPHQGTPILSNSLLEDICDRQPFAVGLKNKLALKVLNKRYKYAFTEQAWTDFSKDFANVTSYQVPAAAFHPSPNSIERFITYGSYFYPSYYQGVFEFVPNLLSEIIPRVFLNREASMKELNRLLAWKIYRGENYRLLRLKNLALNDGSIPLSSALWAEKCSQEEAQNFPEWQKLFAENNFCPANRQKTQRVFKNFNHLNWRKPASKAQRFRDQLSLKEEAKTIYDWTIYDLVKNLKNE